MGIYHRDIKPDNIMEINNINNPNLPIVKLLDFGEAKFTEKF